MPLIFLLLPWLELWTLIELGSSTSALTAMLYVLATLMLGAALIRHQGVALLRQMQAQAGSGRMLGPQLLMDDLALVSCGLLLMIPGLITDLLAVVFLIGPLRRRLLGVWQRPDAVVEEPHTRPQGPSQRGPVTLEGEFERERDQHH